MKFFKNNYYRINELANRLMKLYSERNSISGFAFQKDDVHIVGEIKGVNTNVNNSHVAKSEVHRQEYIEQFTREEKEFDESKIFSILIINPPLLSGNLNNSSS